VLRANEKSLQILVKTQVWFSEY